MYQPDDIGLSCTMDAPRSSTGTYPRLLEEAYAMGRMDGVVAAGFEPPGTVDLLRSTCRGRDPVSFARLVWGNRPGQPPSGLELNAPVWYLRGFADALAEPTPARAPSPIPAPRRPR